MAREVKATPRVTSVPTPQSADDVINRGIGGQAQPAHDAPAPTAEATTAKAADKVKPKRVQPKRAPAPAADGLPWADIPEKELTSYQIDMPSILHMKLKYLGAITWEGTKQISMRQIILRALEAEAARLLKAKGIETE